MSEPKQHAPRRHLRRVLSGTLLAGLFLGSIIVYMQFFTPRQRLWRELAAYQTSIQLGVPRPDLVPHLTSNSVPFLLDWIEAKEFPTSLNQSIARTISALSPSLAAKLASLDSPPQHYPRPLALLGFSFLGSQASAALPLLHQMVMRSEAYHEATTAMISIGPNAFPIAVELASDSHPRIRLTGARLLGAIRSHPDESTAILLKLIDDDDPPVRSEAYRALAEFPSLNNKSTLIPRLDSNSPFQVYAVAYALHSGSTNALIHLLSIARDSTNPLRMTGLGALALRDQISKIQTASDDRDSLYHKKWFHYSHTVTSVQMRLIDKSPDESQFDRIRSNILSTGLPHVEETLGPAEHPLPSPNLKQNQ